MVVARAEKVQPFDMEMFSGFSTLRALTYTPSIPMIVGLLRDHDYEQFECIFGHNGILTRDAVDIMAFQTVIDERLNRGFVAVKGMSDERREVIYKRAADGSARFYVVKDAIAHAKIYLLERDGLRRVIVGSANLSETAFSGRQAETLVVFENDEIAWEHYSSQYEAVREIATSKVDLRVKPVPAELIPIDETPVLKDAEASSNGVTIYVPAESDEEVEFSIPKVLQQVEHIKPVRRRALADVRPNDRGFVRLVPTIVKQMTRIAISSQDDEGPKTYLSHDGRRFDLSGSEMSLETDPADVRSDVEAWLEFFGNYANGFVGDVPRLQRDYFTFMCWFYFSPLMCDVRNAALRQNVFSFDQPMFAVIYGQSNCGKSSLIETLMRSMFSYPRVVDTQAFTRSNLRGLQQAYRRFPVVFDDVTRDRFNRHAPEIIKDENIQFQEYPCFALSMNAEARNFPSELVKRCLMIYTRTSLPGDDPGTRRRLLLSVAGIRERLTTSLYQHYLSRVLDEMKHETPSGEDETDVLLLSSTVLCEIFRENLPDGASLPDWCTPMTLAEYQTRAFERPKMVLGTILHPDKYTRDRRPEIGSWTVSGDLVLVSVDSIASRRTRDEIPDWILDDTSTVAGQIGMRRESLEDFLGYNLSHAVGWRRFLPFG